LLISAVLIVFARPIAVGITLLPFRFNFREKLFISWVGLKGAVPITLATFPLLLGVKNAGLLFDVVFFVVVVSAIVQGWSLPLAARWLGLEVEPEPAPPITLELSSLRHVDGDIVDYSVGPQSRAAGRLVKDLALPDGVVIAIIARGEKLIPPQGSTRVEEGDHVIVVLRPATRPLVNRIFGSAGGQREELPALMEFPLRATTTVGELEEMYDIEMKCPPEITLADAIRTRLGSEVPFSGRVVRFGRIALRVREFTATGHIAKVSMLILADAEEESDEREPAAEDASTSIASAQEGRVE
jgi:cell volume regulation protein A